MEVEGEEEQQPGTPTGGGAAAAAPAAAAKGSGDDESWMDGMGPSAQDGSSTPAAAAAAGDAAVLDIWAPQREEALRAPAEAAEAEAAAAAAAAGAGPAYLLKLARRSNFGSNPLSSHNVKLEDAEADALLVMVAGGWAAAHALGAARECLPVGELVPAATRPIQAPAYS